MRLKRTYLCFGAALIITSSAFGQAAVTNEPPKSPPWDVSAAAGLTLTRGNSRTLLFTGNVLGIKKWEQNELDLGADGVYGKNSGVENAESVHGFSQYNRLFSDRFYGYLRVDGLHDHIAGITYRVTVGPGVGYYFIKETNTTLKGEVGTGYVYERDDDGEIRKYVTLRIAERGEHKMNDFVRLWESAEFLPQVDRFGNYILNTELGVETLMSKKLSLLSYLQDTYHSEPAPGRLKNDIKLVTALKYHF